MNSRPSPISVSEGLGALIIVGLALLVAALFAAGCAVTPPPVVAPRVTPPPGPLVASAKANCHDLFRDELGREPEATWVEGCATRWLTAGVEGWQEQQRAELQASEEYQNKRPVMPPAPTKRELMEAQYTFQGLRANCPQYDARPLPIFDPMRDVVDQACRDAIDAAHRAAGDKVIGVALSHQYDEPGVIPVLRWGKDWTTDLPGLHAYLVDIIQRGFYVQLHLAGDGHSVKDASGRYVYNDPVGHTYGCEWLNETFPQIADALEDIHPYIRFLPGYDGVFYGCETPDGQVIEMPRFAAKFKDRWPDGVLGIEFNTGHLPFGEGDTDWQPGGRMQDFDMVFAEFDGNLDQDSTWQIVARLMKRKGEYRRPPEQPAWDDPDPPAYLGKWPGVAVCFEWATYDDVRFRLTSAQVDAGRQKLRAIGCPFVG